jgi:hypothetical protein
MRARYAAALEGELKLENVLAAFDAMAKEVDAGARRDERKWSAQVRAHYGPMSDTKRTSFTTFPEEVAYVRQWIRSRWAHLRTLYP